MISFFVPGEPVPKQSFKYRKGGGYQPARVTEWQEAVGWMAKEAMQGKDLLAGPIEVEVGFVRSNKRRCDIDNLQKAVSDALQGVVFADDDQIHKMVLYKFYDKDAPGAWIQVRQL